jgi:hypothetical protein
MVPGLLLFLGWPFVFFWWPFLAFGAILSGVWTAFEWPISRDRRRVKIGAAITLLQGGASLISLGSYLSIMRSIGQGM